MLEVAPSEEGEGENGGATTSPKGALEEGGIENPSLQGEKRTASEGPEAKAPKRGEEIFTRGSCIRGGPGRTVFSKESALQRSVSRKGGVH